MVAATVEKEAGKKPVLGADQASEDYALHAWHILGGRNSTKPAMRSSLDAHDMIMKGFDTKALLHLIESVSFLAVDELLQSAVGISQRTLQRKRSAERLSTEQSSRLWRFAEILAQATNTLGSQKEAERWIMEPAMGLDNRRPIDLLATAAGAEAVEEHLTRMEYGVYI
tara:strand:+ start:1474 stop:1980 length:507 start_codon:yes stop_codon:yes gene_type:complete